MRITYFGPGDFLEDAFLAGAGADLGHLEPFNATPTSFMLRNTHNGLTTTFTGTGLPSEAQLDEDILFGTITGWKTVRGSGASAVVEAEVTGISWPLETFVAALSELRLDPEEPLLVQLLNRQENIVFDASKATVAVDDLSFHDVTPPVTLLGSAFGGSISGGETNDTIDIGNTRAGAGTSLLGSMGSDRILFSKIEPGGGWAELVYAQMHEHSGGNVPITVTINGRANTGLISGAWGTDTLVDVAKILDDSTEGMTLVGTRNNDVFTIDGGAASWLNIDGGPGLDTYNLTLSGAVRLSFRGIWTGNKPTQGVDINLGTRQIANDGYGNVEQLTVTPGAGRLEVQGSDNADRLTGSAANDRFIASGGNDKIDGGDGWDMLRYDRSQISTGVQVDLGAGTVLGQWTPTGMSGQIFRQEISGIEEIRGSSHGDSMTAAGLTEGVRFDARGGNDTLTGGDGSDTLLGGNGDDTLKPGNNRDKDALDPGRGNDVIDFATTSRGYFEIEHRDLANAGGQNISIERGVVGGQAPDVATINKGANGLTTLLNVEKALQADGLRIVGSNQNDHYAISLGYRDWLDIQGGRGQDSYSLSGVGSFVRLRFDEGALGEEAINGASVNLATGVIANDGFGHREEISTSDGVFIRIVGTKHADALTGSANDDHFSGLGGYDILDGGAGFDTVNYRQDGMTTGVTVDLGRGTAKGQWEGVAFTHTLSNIEAVTGTKQADILLGTGGENLLVSGGGNDRLFADGVKASAFLTEAAQVYRFYQSTLGREADVAGHQYWTQQLALGQTTRDALAQSFMGSQEFLKSYGSLSKADLIGKLYENVLGRPASTAEVNAWLATNADATRIVIGLSDSPEFIAKTRAAATQFALESDDAFWTGSVYLLYQATLDREPDLAGLTGWSASLARGTALTTAAKGFVDSPEFQNEYGSLSNSEFINLLYRNVLGRDADAGGLAGWLSAMSEGRSRAEVVLGFSQSSEFIKGTAAGLHDWVSHQGRSNDLVVSGDGGDVQLYGGALVDAFQFNASAKGNHTLYGLDSWDIFNFYGFGFASGADLMNHFRQAGENVIFSDQGVTVTFVDATLDSLPSDMFWS